MFLYRGVIGPGLSGKGLSHFGFDYLQTSDDYQITEAAVRFISEQSSSDRPFYLQVNHNWVHTPLRSQEDRIARFADQIDSKSLWQNPADAAVLEEVDESVGRILAAVDEAGLRDNTVVMFLSDHGGYLGFCEEDFEEFGQAEPVTSNAPLREGKASLYEGGVRIPWIVRWPSHLQSGRVCKEPVNQVDLYPTFLEIVGLEPPAREELDGLGLRTLFENPDRSLGPRTFYWHWPHYRRTRAGPEAAPSSAVRCGDWKLIEFFEDGRMELYNVAEDIRESQDRAATDLQKRAELYAMLGEWREKVGAQLPKRNPDYT